MNPELVIFYVFLGVSLINLLHFGFYLVGANLYDIWQFKRSRQKRSHAKLPLVSIVIAAHNEEKVLNRTLASLTQLNYPHLQIIVVDDGSTDSTRQIIRTFVKTHPKVNAQLAYKRTNIGKGGALNHGIQRYAKGEFIMTLDADSTLHPMAIRNAVRYFEDPKVAAVAANVRIIEERSILSLLQMLEHMIGYRSKKAYAVTNSECIVGGVGSTYRRSIMEQVGYYDDGTKTEDIGLSMKVASLGNKNYRLVYASDVVAMTEGVATFGALMKQRFRWKYGMLQNLIKYSGIIGKSGGKYTRSLTWYRLPMAFLSEIMLLIEPLILGYVLYVSYLLQNPGSIIGSYILITIYLALNLLPDEHSSRKRRIRLAFYAPLAYFIFYIMNLVQLSAIIRCLFKGRSLLQRRAVSGAWRSADRRGTAEAVLS